MEGKPRNATPLIAALLLAVGLGLTVWVLKPHPTPAPPPPGSLADLGTPPDWSRLDPYQGTISRAEFTQLLEEVYTIGTAWKEFIELTEAAALIQTTSADPADRYRLEFGPTGPAPAELPRFWRPAQSLGPAPAARPLEGVRIAIDPGHIGGAFARMEARWFQVGTDTKPVMEGEMTLLVAQHLEKRLTALGASVHLLRTTNAPVTRRTATELESYARRTLGSSSPEEARQFAEKLFYRTAEIRARAALVNDEIHPDLVLCLHFNAEAWGNPSAPSFSPRNHVHLLLNGAYTSGEVAHQDERLEMLLRIVQRMLPEEQAIAGELIEAFQEVTKLPPYEYEPNSTRAINLKDNPYLWARNLLANRLYNCPVLFLEPYVMNNSTVYARAQAGDYAGTKDIDGVSRPSIYREYAEAVALGLERYYRQHRRP